jgi:hypothetical protein
MTLVEEDQVDFDAGIGQYLPTSILSGLHDFGVPSYGPPRHPVGTFFFRSRSAVENPQTAASPGTLSKS